MKNKTNEEIRNAAKKNGIFLWQIAEILGVSEPTMTRKMRRELSDNEKLKILSIIEDLAKKGDGINSNNVIN